MDLVQNIIPYMHRGFHELDIPMTPMQEAYAADLALCHLDEIDNFLMACLTMSGQKTAKTVYIAAQAITHFQSTYPYLPDVFYSGRLKVLCLQGRLDAIGNLDCMRLSEVKLNA